MVKCKRYLRYGLIAVSGIALMGCTTSAPVTEQAQLQARSDQFLLESGNFVNLIERYEKQLKQSPSAEVRYKLADVYFRSGDSEAAAYQLSFIQAKEMDSSDLHFLKAQVYFDQNRLSIAEQNINAVLRKDAEYGAAYNLRGLIKVEQGDLSGAKQAFEDAREQRFDDATIKNNLAMVDILLGDYSQAIERLIPLLESGRADETTKANLVLALAKAGKTDEFRRMLKDSDTDPLLAEKYNSLNSSERLASKPVATVLPGNLVDGPVNFKEENLLAPNLTASTVKKAPVDRNVLSATPATKASHALVTTSVRESHARPTISRQPATVSTPLAKANTKVKVQDVESLRYRASLSLPENNASLQKFTISNLHYQVTQTGHQYQVLHDGQMGWIKQQVLVTKSKTRWVFDFYGRGRFKTDRKRHYRIGPVKTAEFGLHPNFVRLVFTTRNKTVLAPKLEIYDDRVSIKWQ